MKMADALVAYACPLSTAVTVHKQIDDSFSIKGSEHFGFAHFTKTRIDTIVRNINSYAGRLSPLPSISRRQLLDSQPTRDAYILYSLLAQCVEFQQPLDRTVGSFKGGVQSLDWQSALIYTSIYNSRPNNLRVSDVHIQAVRRKDMGLAKQVLRPNRFARLVQMWSANVQDFDFDETRNRLAHVYTLAKRYGDEWLNSSITESQFDSALTDYQSLVAYFESI
jgi:hypothetical protein